MNLDKVNDLNPTRRCVAEASLLVLHPTAGILSIEAEAMKEAGGSREQPAKVWQPWERDEGTFCRMMPVRTSQQIDFESIFIIW
jgi:hypothetical protein